ncbi:MAG: ribosome maturation factor RimM [Muribaculaceae bacterium]|nr:ribosome maturation factor RimM [Muribaculaceae bacterium]
MILLTELEPIGRAIKTHALQGELAVELNCDFDTDELKHLVLRIDGIFVPFRIESLRMRGSSGALMRLAGVCSADEASAYAGLDLYALRREIPQAAADEDEDDGLYAEDLEGFTLTRPDGSVIGIIDAVDTTTINTLLHVSGAGSGDTMIPLAEDWICTIDAESRTLAMDIPEALLEL